MYILVAGVLTGMVRWQDVNIEAPIAEAFLDRGLAWPLTFITVERLRASPVSCWSCSPRTDARSYAMAKRRLAAQK